MPQTYGDWYTERLNDFSPGRLTTLRWVSVSSSIVSIVFGVIFLYLYINMRYKVFRHHLIFLLIFFDFGKAIVLLWYPARVLSVPSSYNNVNFCDVVGWFTSSFIEGADFAVFFLAIHTALLVFRRDSNAVEGGLYKVRYYIYAINILLPATLASLAFIHAGRKSYLPYITWCYLPIRPIWYRLVLSWIPRYIILISILGIYLAIYIHVKLEYRRVVQDFQRSQTFVEDNYYEHGFSGKLRKFGRGFVHSLSYFPGLGFLDKTLPQHGQPNEQGRFADSQTTAIMEFQRDSVVKFQIRRSMIERQIRSIFIYPFAYFFLWLAPFVVQCLQYDYEVHHGPVYWITALAAFMQPFNCAVDTVAFIVREKPWRNRTEKIFTKENGRWMKKRLTFTHEQDLEKTPQQGNENDHEQQNPSPKTVVDKNMVRLQTGSRLEYYDEKKISSSRSTSAASKSPNTTHPETLAYPEHAHIDPFSHTTATPIDLPPRRPFEFDRASNASASNSERSMDLMEFLR
jgi:G protein-coupled receptor GPR1